MAEKQPDHDSKRVIGRQRRHKPAFWAQFATKMPPTFHPAGEGLMVADQPFSNVWRRYEATSSLLPTEGG